MDGSWFQSLGRDSVGWDDLCPDNRVPTLTVSIPRSGFCGVGPVGVVMATPGGRRFNPSVGILWGGTFSTLFHLAELCQFQSLGRDSVGWDPEKMVHPSSPGAFQSLGRDSVGWDQKSLVGDSQSLRCFNPSVGILWGGTRGGRNIGPCQLTVSIPRSGFCGVGLR